VWSWTASYHHIISVSSSSSLQRELGGCCPWRFERNPTRHIIVSAVNSGQNVGDGNCTGSILTSRAVLSYLYSFAAWAFRLLSLSLFIPRTSGRQHGRQGPRSWPCRTVFAVATDSIVFARVYFPVRTITHKPLHLVRWNFLRTCILTTARNTENIKVIGQMSRSQNRIVEIFTITR